MASKDGETRKQLVEAAHRVLSAKGYEQTSIKDIAREAGVSPGLVHYYFANKDELLAVVVREVANEYCAIMEFLSRSGQGPKLAAMAFQGSKDMVHQQPDWYRLRYELFVLGLRNASIQQEVKDLLERSREEIKQVAFAITGQPFAEHSGFSSLLLSCFDGIALQSLMDPNFDLEGAYRVLSEMTMQYLASQTESKS